MSIRRVITAHCDREGCYRFIDLNPDSNQHFVELLRRDWTTENTETDILTFCPDHPTEEA